MRRHLVTLGILTVLLLVGCAKVVVPTGGPKDMEPPKMQKEDPPALTVNFKAPQIKIAFDEFFTLQNPTENVLISPPMSTSPKYSISGKNLIIKFTDTLQPNTTYNMVFSDCIRDYNEGNPIPYYHYSFSTGPVIDSCTIKGSVRDALTLDACKDYFVMLYKKDVDSLPLTTLPDYITKSQSNGNFNLDNIAPGFYKIFALKDINANLLYDLPNERVAFSDGLVEAAVIVSPKDSTRQVDIQEVQLLSFEQAPENPQLAHVENPAAGVFILPYMKPVSEFSAEALGQNIPYFERFNESRDTIFWYMKEAIADTLSYRLHADGHTDTLTITPYKEVKLNGRGSSRNERKSVLNVTARNQGHRFKPLSLAFSYPIRPADSIAATFISRKDTQTVYVSVPDSFVMQLPIPFSYSDKQSYTLIIPDSVFWGYNNLTNDSIRLNFETRSLKDYGNLTMEYVCPETGGNFIAQLWKDKTLIQQDMFTNTCKIPYLYLDPGNYRIKVIEDLNGNGHWDPGNYSLHLQPERVFFFHTDVTIRAYWDSEEQFRIGEIRDGGDMRR